MVVPVVGVACWSRPTPLPSVWGVVLEGGTSTTAHRVVGGFLVRLQLAVGREREVLAGCGGPGTLLGPEGTAGWLLSLGSGPGRVRLVGCGRLGVAFGSSLFRVPLGADLRVGCRLARECGGGAGRCLRTAQWTRASLNESLCGQVYKGTGWMPWH